MSHALAYVVIYSIATNYYTLQRWLELNRIQRSEYFFSSHTIPEVKIVERLIKAHRDSIATGNWGEPRNLQVRPSTRAKPYILDVVLLFPLIARYTRLADFSSGPSSRLAREKNPPPLRDNERIQRGGGKKESERGTSLRWGSRIV